MTVEAVVIGATCGDENCGVLRVAASVAGVGLSARWENWHQNVKDPAGGVFLVLGAGHCGSDVKDLERWFRQRLDLALRIPALRTWPIVVLSPHAPKWLRDLRESCGLDIELEPFALIGNVPHAVRADRSLCEDDIVQREAQRILARLAISKPGWLRESRPDLITAANLRQAISVLETEARHLHGDLHSLRSNGPPTGEGPTPSDRISGVSRTLKFLVEPRIVEEFAACGADSIQRLGGRDEQVAAAAAFLEESAAMLLLRSGAARRREIARLAALVIDDDAEVVESIQSQFQGSADVRVIPIPLPHDAIRKAVRETTRCGGDPSLAVADAVSAALDSTLAELGARTRWALDGAQYVLVADIRLAPEAPDAGLWIIRRARDRYPFVRTVALTVRRGLADELADEAVDAYVVKVFEHRETGRRVGEAIRTVTASGLYLLLPGTEDIADDVNFRSLVENKYMLTRAPLASGGVRVAFAQVEDLPAAAAAVAGDGIIVAVVPADYESGSAFRLMKNLKRTRVSLLRRAKRCRGDIRLLPSGLVKLDRMLHPGQVAKHDVRWTLLVPKTASWGGLTVLPHERDLIGIRSAVAERFGGATGSEASGMWIRPSDHLIVRDDLEALEVWARGTESGRRHMTDIARDVVRTFGQDEVYVLEESIKSWSIVPDAVLPTYVDVDNCGRLVVAFACDAVFEPGEPERMPLLPINQ
jgi:hypothetical protein